MKCFPIEGRALKFNVLWFVASATGVALGHYLTWHLGIHLYESNVSGVLGRLFVTLLLENSIIVGLLCASLGQGWLLSTRGVAFWHWSAASVAGYAAGITFIYWTDIQMSEYRFWGLPITIIIVSLLQADQLRGYVHRPYAWFLGFSGLMFLMNGFFLILHILVGMSANAYAPHFALSLITGIGVGTVATISFISTKPTFLSQARL